VLTAVDAAVMVIDAAKGRRAQTIKLLEVCRLRATPIITFVNKMDREVRPPIELLEEIERVLGIDCAPVSWPIGMGKSFRGVFDLMRERLKRFAPGEERVRDEGRGDRRARTTRGSMRCFPTRCRPVRHDVELIRSASHPFEMEEFLTAGRRRSSSDRASTISASGDTDGR
jgi:peptide chain release factor 3